MHLILHIIIILGVSINENLIRSIMRLKITLLHLCSGANNPQFRVFRTPGCHLHYWNYKI